MVGTGGREPAAAVIKPARGPADFASAGAAGLRHIDGLLDPGGRVRRQGAVPIKPQGAEFFLDLRGPEGSAVSLDRCPDPDAGALQQVAPALAAFGGSRGRTRVVRRRMKEVGVGPDQVRSPIPYDARHFAPRFLRLRRHGDRPSRRQMGDVCHQRLGPSTTVCGPSGASWRFSRTRFSQARAQTAATTSQVGRARSSSSTMGWRSPRVLPQSSAGP